MNTENKNIENVTEQPITNNTASTPSTQEVATEKETKEPTVQDLMIEIAKLKRGLDKASSEAADYKKKYNATLSEKEQADLEKAEREAEKEEKFNHLN